MILNTIIFLDNYHAINSHLVKPLPKIIFRRVSWKDFVYFLFSFCSFKLHLKIKVLSCYVTFTMKPVWNLFSVLGSFSRFFDPDFEEQKQYIMSSAWIWNWKKMKMKKKKKKKIDRTEFFWWRREAQTSWLSGFYTIMVMNTWGGAGGAG